MEKLVKIQEHPPLRCSSRAPPARYYPPVNPRRVPLHRTKLACTTARSELLNRRGRAHWVVPHGCARLAAGSFSAWDDGDVDSQRNFRAARAGLETPQEECARNVRMCALWNQWAHEGAGDGGVGLEVRVAFACFTLRGPHLWRMAVPSMRACHRWLAADGWTLAKVGAGERVQRRRRMGAYAVTVHARPALSPAIPKRGAEARIRARGTSAALAASSRFSSAATHHTTFLRGRVAGWASGDEGRGSTRWWRRQTRGCPSPRGAPTCTSAQWGTEPVKWLAGDPGVREVQGTSCVIPALPSRPRRASAHRALPDFLGRCARRGYRLRSSCGNARTSPTMRKAVKAIRRTPLLPLEREMGAAMISPRHFPARLCAFRDRSRHLARRPRANSTPNAAAAHACSVHRASADAAGDAGGRRTSCPGCGFRGRRGRTPHVMSRLRVSAAGASTGDVVFAASAATLRPRNGGRGSGTGYGKWMCTCLGSHTPALPYPTVLLYAGAVFRKREARIRVCGACAAWAASSCSHSGGLGAVLCEKISNFSGAARGQNGDVEALQIKCEHRKETEGCSTYFRRARYAGYVKKSGGAARRQSQPVACSRLERKGLVAAACWPSAPIPAGSKSDGPDDVGCAEEGALFAHNYGLGILGTIHRPDQDCKSID
ncbi:hypothetical protein B0H10DRAFT_1970101 [Mycena sp. CBHHK59/15]|nr:hypothetical protein B0H10DRAFT_1970101 [Mycena sp. CBHHK59/15]